MSKQQLTVGCGSSCAVCRLEEAVRLAESGLVDYLALDRQAERGTAQLQLRKSQGLPAYDGEFEQYCRALFPFTARGGPRLITNGGGEDPEAALDVALRVARELGLEGVTIAATTNVDALATVVELDPVVQETGRPLSELEGEIVGVTPYFSAREIVDALAAGADVVITGRVGDSTLYLAPMIHELGWQADEWQALARGLALGHMMECGGQLTGGYFASPPHKIVHDLARLGLPYAEVDASGDGILTKLPGTGGLVTELTCKEQMLYEVGDPSRYIHPDVIVDWTTATLTQEGPDRVRLAGVSGHPAPETLKVLVTVKEGYIGEGYSQFGGSDALERAQIAEQVMRERLVVRGITPLELRFAYVGIDSLFAPWSRSQSLPPREVMLHAAGRFATFEEAEAFTVEFHMGGGNHYGPAGGTSGRRLLPVDDTPTCYSVLVPREALEEPDVVIRHVGRDARLAGMAHE